jgi:Tetratricopeptide repeat
VNSCAVLVALIGRQWATLTDEDGVRRLDNPDDYVRFEVKTALERGVRVIPVLIDGAKPLRQQELPAELHKLARLNAHKLSWDRYQDDADRLLDLIQRVLATAGEQAQTDRSAQEGADQAPAEAGRQAQEKARDKAGEKARQTNREKQAQAVGEAGDPAAARDQFAALLPMRERMSGAEHPMTLTARNNLARWTGEAGDPFSARDQFAALVPIEERVLGAEHPDTLVTRDYLAWWTAIAGDADGACDQFAALVPIKERVLGAEHPDTLTSRRKLALITGQAGNPASARDQFAALVPIYERVFGVEDVNTQGIRMSRTTWAEVARIRRSRGKMSWGKRS